MKNDRLHETAALRIVADRVPDSGLALSLRLGPEWVSPYLGPAYHLVGDGVDVAFVADLIGEHVEARGELSLTVGYACSRCGESAQRQLHERWRVLFLAEVAEEGDEGSDAGSGDGADIVVAHLRDGVADLEGPLGEALVLALPAWPMCREDCRGLCAGCGTDLNEGSCRCEDTKKDARWAKLAELRDKLGR